jgi:hypothetical protein
MGRSGGGGGVGSEVRREEWGRLWLVWKKKTYLEQNHSNRKERINRNETRSLGWAVHVLLEYSTGIILILLADYKIRLLMHFISLLMIFIKRCMRC